MNAEKMIVLFEFDVDDIEASLRSAMRRLGPLARRAGAVNSYVAIRESAAAALAAVKGPAVSTGEEQKP